MTDEIPIGDVGSDYVQPADRPAAWAAMAAGLANDGRSPAQIADALCVDEPTVHRLLELAAQDRAEVPPGHLTTCGPYCEWCRDLLRPTFSELSADEWPTGLLWPLTYPITPEGGASDQPRTEACD